MHVSQSLNQFTIQAAHPFPIPALGERVGMSDSEWSSVSDGVPVAASAPLASADPSSSDNDSGTGTSTATGYLFAPPGPSMADVWWHTDPVWEVVQGWSMPCQRTLVYRDLFSGSNTVQAVHQASCSKRLVFRCPVLA